MRRRLATPAEAAGRFRVPGRLVSVAPTGSGNVNDTYLAVSRTPFDERRFILQKISARVFKRPDWIMANMRVVTEHAFRKIAREASSEDRVWQLPRVIACRDGRDYWRDAAGGCWRAISHIASAVSHETVRGPEHALEAGAVLGQFHRWLSDLKPARLRDTLPGFHVTPLYLERFDSLRRGKAGAARLRADPEARRLARFVEERRGLAAVLESARAGGELSPRLIHGDPKVSNVMIDELTGKGTSIVDLDTVKPGLVHYDFGDALRSVANPAGEEARNLSRVGFDLDLCAAFVRGYLARARSFLTAADRRYLFDSIRLIAFELGLRFLSDHLAGNVYFKVQDPEHNLRRARVQFRLCESIETQEAAIRKVLAKNDRMRYP